MKNKQFHKGRRIGGKKVLINWGFPHSSIGKESAYSVGDLGSIPGSGRFLEKEMVATLVFLPEKFHGQKSLVGCIPWGHKESGTTEQLTLSPSLIN